MGAAALRAGLRGCSNACSLPRILRFAGAAPTILSRASKRLLTCLCLFSPLCFSLRPALSAATTARSPRPRRFIEMYHDPELLLTAEAGYCFANLTSAVMFLENFSRKSAIDMGLEPKHFDAALERAEADAAARAAEQRAGPRRRTTLHNVFQQKLERALAFKNIPARPPPAPQGKGRPRGHARRATAVPATLQASSRQAASAAAAAQPRSRRASSGGTVGFDSPVNRARAEERRAQCLAAAAASAAGSSFGPGELMASHGGAFPVVLAVRGQDGCLAELRLTALCAPHALILVDRKSACAEPLYIWACVSVRSAFAFLAASTSFVCSLRALARSLPRSRPAPRSRAAVHACVQIRHNREVGDEALAVHADALSAPGRRVRECGGQRRSRASDGGGFQYQHCDDEADWKYAQDVTACCMTTFSISY